MKYEVIMTVSFQMDADNDDHAEQKAEEIDMEIENLLGFEIDGLDYIAVEHNVRNLAEERLSE